LFLNFKDTDLPSISNIEKSTSLPRTDNIFVSLVVSYTPKSADFPSKSFIDTEPNTDLSVIPNVPDLKQLPDFNVEIKLDTTFISTFIKAKNALIDENNFTFTCKDNKGTIVLGHSNINTNRINIDVDCKCDGDVKPISFSATYLKEILVANKEATDATLQISSQGLAHISFSIDNYESNYYLVEIAS